MSGFFQNLQRTLIIAEIGQNHQGDLELAKKLIKIAKECGADCVKFQKSDLPSKFTKSALITPYESPHSFGITYGEHKEFLEFNQSQYKILQEYATNEVGVLFTASAMDEVSLDFLVEIGVPFIKIGSGDGNNFKLVEKAAKTGIPLVISTGMQNFETVKELYNIVSRYHHNFSLLHCVSSYPTPIEDINLRVLQLYQKEFPDITIGYSGHELGIHISLAAVALGSKIIERHLTLDKSWKGNDHACSLEPGELRELVRNVRSLEIALGTPVKILRDSERSCYDKLGKTLVYAGDFKSGHALRYEDVNVKVAVPKGVDGREFQLIIGKVLNKNVVEDESVMIQHFLN